MASEEPDGLAGDAGGGGGEVGPTHMIDAKGEFSPAMEEFTMNIAEESEGEEAMVVSVLGVRGSGKSSLLNEVFGCHFGVGRSFVPSKGTKGAWVELSKVGSKPIVVVDTQGCDGRGAEMERVNRIATFTLCFSDALIFNIWCADVGRYDAAGYGFLRTIFHEYVRLFHEENRPTLIVFVIRDHDDGSSLDSLKNVLMSDIDNIWAQVSKPSGHENIKLDTLFHFEFVSLPHIRHRRAEFDQGIAKLREALTEEASASYLIRREYSKVVPLEAFGTYLDFSWKDLGKDGEIEQPTRRDLVAAYRCDVAFHAQHGQALKVFNRWSNEVDGGKLVSSFGSESSKLLVARMEAFEEATSMHANAPARIKKQSELSNYLRTNIGGLFQKQIFILQSQHLQKFKELLLTNLTQSAAMNAVLEEFSRKAEMLVVDEMLLSFHQAKGELETVLTQFAQQYEDSPAVQLTEMQRYQRRAQQPIRREPDANISLTLTGAMRPPGYGNFQLVTGYSNGPLAMNFSLCNDANAAEQEGHGRVPFFKLQPTLNYDLDL